MDIKDHGVGNGWLLQILQDAYSESVTRQVADMARHGATPRGKTHDVLHLLGKTWSSWSSQDMLRLSSPTRLRADLLINQW